MSKTFRVGIVGCGGIANGKHLPSLKAIENVEICRLFMNYVIQ